MRPSNILLIGAAALLSACQPSSETVSTADSAAASPPPSAPAPATAPAKGKGDMPDMNQHTLAGEYRVAAIDGTEVGGGIGIALTVTDTLIWFDPRCAGFNWTYTYVDGRLTTDRPQKPRAPGAPLSAGPGAATCRIAVHPEQQRLAAALDAVTNARRTQANGIELNGGGHSVTLFSQ